MREGISGVIDADSCKGYTQQREGGRRMVRILFYHFSRASMTFVCNTRYYDDLAYLPLKL